MVKRAAANHQQPKYRRWQEETQGKLKPWFLSHKTNMFTAATKYMWDFSLKYICPPTTLIGRDHLLKGCFA